MIEIPDSVLRKQLNSNLKRGKVLRTEIFFDNTPRFKRLVLLNKDFSVDDIFYILSTSEVARYKKYGHLKPLKGNYTYVPKGQTCLNPNEEMVIDCRIVDFIKKEKLLENYKNKKLQFLDSVPRDILGEIDRILLNSILIPPKIKKQII